MGKHSSAAVIGSITREVRKLFHMLGSIGDALHADIAIVASMRAVMESIARDGPSTVPQMARARPVTRQHIQVLVDQLLAAGLVELRPNPAHKRSPLVALTALGASAFDAMSRREAVLLERLADGMNERDLKTTLEILGHLKDRLSGLLDQHAANKETTDA